LQNIPGIQLQSLPEENCIDVCWMNAIVLNPSVYRHAKDETIRYLKEHGVDTRLLFNGMHNQKSLKDYGCDCGGEYPVCDWLTENGFYLPSASNLKAEDIDYICNLLKEYHQQ
jgi:perosamine synthetase